MKKKVLMIQKYKEIIEFLKTNKPLFIEDGLSFDNTDEIKEQLKSLEISYNNRWDNTIHVEIDNFPIKIFNDKNSYLKLNLIKSEDLIIVGDGTIPILSWLSNTVYNDLDENNEDNFFSNAIAYKEFIDFLKSQDSDNEEAFHFVDYINDSARRIVFTSLSDKGRVIINFYNHVKPFDANKDYQLGLETFKKCFLEETNNLEKFLKNSVIEHSIRFPKEERIFMLFENLTEITSEAKINFEIFLNGLSIEKIIKEYDEYKAKYFKELSDILNNLTTKIIGLPLLLVTTLFAIEKLKDSQLLLMIIIAAIATSTIYLIALLNINFKDLNYIQSIAEKDYRSLLKNKFFIKYPEEIVDFEKIKNKINSRITYLKTISESYYWLLGISNIGIICLITDYLKLERNIIALFSLVTIFVLAVSRNFIISKIE